MTKSPYTRSGPRATMRRARDAAGAPRVRIPEIAAAAAPAPDPEHLRARRWREGMGFTRPELARRTGYSVRTIQEYEDGQRPNGRPIAPDDWLAYRLACAAVAGGVEFDWQTVRLHIGDVEVSRRVKHD